MCPPIDSIDLHEPIDDPTDTDEVVLNADSSDGDLAGDSDILDDLAIETLEDGLSDQLEESRDLGNTDALALDDGLILGAPEGELINTFPSSIDLDSGTEPLTSIIDTPSIAEGAAPGIRENSVCKIISDNGSTGTGFFINPSSYSSSLAEDLCGDKLIATNAHVIDGDVDGQVEISIGTDGSTIDAHIVSSHEGADVALLRVDASALRNIEVIELPLATEARIGEDFTQLGYPGGGDLVQDSGVIHEGSIILKRQSQDGDLHSDISVIHDADSSPGDSGGPLINSTGEVIGMTRATFKGTSIQVGVRPQDILDMIALSVQEGLL